MYLLYKTQAIPRTIRFNLWNTVRQSVQLLSEETPVMILIENIFNNMLCL